MDCSLEDIWKERSSEGIWKVLDQKSLEDVAGRTQAEMALEIPDLGLEGIPGKGGSYRTLLVLDD